MRQSSLPQSGARATRAADLLAPVVIHYHGWTGHKGSIDTPDQSLVQLASEPASTNTARGRVQGDPMLTDVMEGQAPAR